MPRVIVSCACAGILQGDAEHLGRIATYFDTSLRIAVGQANRELGEERIVYVSRLDLFRDGSHELCGTGGEWLNGISNNRDQTGSMRWEGSFHPNAKGHIGTADYLTQIINLPAAEAFVGDLDSMRCQEMGLHGCIDTIEVVGALDPAGE